MTTTTFILNEKVISSLGKVRKFAEDAVNWNGVEDGRLQMTDFSHVLDSGDVRAAFSWVIAGDSLIRHLSVRSLHWVKDPSVYVDPSVGFTLAHFLGFTGAQIGKTGMVVDQPKNWRSGIYQRDGSFIVQQDVQKIGTA